MKKTITLVSILYLFFSSSCTSVYVTKHPDYHFFPTNPNSIRIYDQFIPNYPFTIIGRIEIDSTWSLSDKAFNEKVKKEAASIGGDAVIITDIELDKIPLNQSVTTTGTIRDTGYGTYRYTAESKDTSSYITKVSQYGYVIKREFSHYAGGQSYKNKKIIVHIVEIKNWIEFKIKIATSINTYDILVFRRADASNISWLKVGMYVEMFYVRDTEVYLYGPDGESSKFKRIK